MNDVVLQSKAKALVCHGPQAAKRFVLAEVERRAPGPGEIEVAVTAASVNPIDVRRAEGYGTRLLRLKGAGSFPMVLGNDCVGTVSRVGSGVTTVRVGETVVGVKPPSAAGTHASHVLLQADHALPAPVSREPAELAVLPYSYVTMWLALRGAGLTPASAAGAKVLVHGAGGGLGLLALRLLADWGAETTALARSATESLCAAAGATRVVNCETTAIAGLGRCFDASLNFAAWDDDGKLLACLREGALGHATTVHPLLANFDRLGWLGGGWASLREWRAQRGKLPRGARRYAWTVFKPDVEALAAFRHALADSRHPLSLPVGLRVPLAEGEAAFAHVAAGRAGRALILP